MKTAKVSAERTKEVKSEQEPKLGLKQAWQEISKKQKSLMAGMIVLAVASAILLVVSLFMLHPQSSVVIVGYGDVYGNIAGIFGGDSGYRRGSWLTMLSFPLLAIVFGVLHNFLALRIYRKYGRDTAMMVVVTTIALVVAALFVLIRLTGEINA